MLGQVLWKDKPRDWGREFSPAPVFNVKEYQDKLNAIAGFTTTGEPVLKLFWGGDAASIKFTEWDLNIATKSELTPMFYYNRRNPISLDSYDQIPIRRWIVAEAAEPSQYRAEDDSDTWFTDPDGVKRQKTLKPKNVFYRAWIVIGDHSKCHADCSKDKLCYGDYAHPNEEYLGFCREATYHLMHDPTRRDPRRPMTHEEVDQLRQEALKENESSDAALNEHMKDFARDWWSAHQHRITSDDPSVLKHGRFHFTKGKENVRTDSAG